MYTAVYKTRRGWEAAQTRTDYGSAVVDAMHLRRLIHVLEARVIKSAGSVNAARTWVCDENAVIQQTED